MSDNTNIRMIPPGQTYPLRNLVLRPGQPVTSCIFERDELQSTMHFGYFHDGELVGIASLYKKDHQRFKGGFQLRGMAVSPQFRNNDIGRALLAYAERLVRNENGTVLWFNARESATMFYKKSGYETDGGVFDIPGVGAHSLMYKKL